MEATVKVTITAIRRKVSMRDNIYHEIDIMEHLISNKGEEAIQPREWKNLFFNQDLETNKKEDLINKKCIIKMAFYPTKRTVGEKIYTNINTHITSVELD